MQGQKHLAAFLDVHRRRGEVLQHLEHLRHALKAFYQWWKQSGRPTRRLDVATLDAYQLWLVEAPSPGGAPRALGTVVKRLAALRSFLHYLGEEKVIVGDLGELVELPHANPSMRRVLSEAELVRLCNACQRRTPEGRRDRAYVELLIATAMRPAEAAALLPSDLHLREARVRIRRGKGGRLRWLPLTRSAVRALRSYLKVRRKVVLPGYRKLREGLLLQRHPERLFLSSKGAFSKPLAVHIVDSAARRAGLDGRITPYTIRHSVATSLVRHGLELRHLQALLGHDKPGTSEIYLHLGPQDLKAVHRRAHPRERNPREPRGARRR